MRPISTPAADTRWIGAGDVGELPAETFLEPAEGGALVRVNRSRWRPDEAERAAIALGGDVVLDVFGSAHPPVRILATVFPVDDADAVFGRIDALVGKATSLAFVAVLATLAIEATIEEIEALDDVEETALGEWLTGWHGRPIGIPWLDARREAAIDRGDLVPETYTDDDRARDSARIDDAIATVEARETES